MIRLRHLRIRAHVVSDRGEVLAQGNGPMDYLDGDAAHGLGSGGTLRRSLGRDGQGGGEEHGHEEVATD